jgi:hypothetical protein
MLQLIDVYFHIRFFVFSLGDRGVYNLQKTAEKPRQAYA